jgi:hypothetical protein
MESLISSAPGGIAAVGTHGSPREGVCDSTPLITPAPLIGQLLKGTTPTTAFR